VCRVDYKKRPGCIDNSTVIGLESVSGISPLAYFLKKVGM